MIDALGDGIAWVSGLPSAAMEELIGFADGSVGLSFQLARERIGCILLRQGPALGAGVAATLTGRRLRIGVGDALLGRVVDPLGAPLDGVRRPPPPRPGWSTRRRRRSWPATSCAGRSTPATW